MQLACLLKAFFIELGYPKSTSNINIQLKHSPENKNLVLCLSDCKYKPTHQNKSQHFRPDTKGSSRPMLPQYRTIRLKAWET